MAYAYLGKPENFDPTKQSLLDYDIKFKNEDVIDIRVDNLYWHKPRSIRGLHRLLFNEDEVKTIKRHYVELFNSGHGYSQQHIINIIKDQYYKNISPRTTKSPSYFKKLISGQKPYHHFKDYIPHENLRIDTKVYVNNKKLKTYLQQGSIVEYDILKDRFLVVMDTGYSITIRAKNLSPIYTHDMNNTDEPYQENDYTEVTYTRNTYATDNEDYDEDSSAVQKIKKTFKDIFG
ncbi:hypothetical protein PBI_SCTP2_59 [Salicola phage SCTP-2]|nr:hypothetical protein PBI_SCTP2_59 [Salicola phage SCTP-2]